MPITTMPKWKTLLPIVGLLSAVLVAACSTTQLAQYPVAWPPVESNHSAACVGIFSDFRDNGEPAPSNPPVVRAVTAVSFRELLDLRYFSGFAKRTGGTDARLIIQQAGHDVDFIAQSADSSAAWTETVEGLTCERGKVTITKKQQLGSGEGFAGARVARRLELTVAEDHSLIVTETTVEKQRDFGVFPYSSTTVRVYRFSR